MVFLSNYLVFKIVLAALGRTDYPVAGDLELKYDNANKVYLSGGSLKYIDSATLWTTIGEETNNYNMLFNKINKTTTTAYETNLPSSSVHGTFGINQDATRYVHQYPVASGYQNGKFQVYSGTPLTGYTEYGSEIQPFDGNETILCSMSADGKYILVGVWASGFSDGYKMYKDNGSEYVYHSSYSCIGSSTQNIGYQPAFVPSNNNFVITGTNNNSTWYFKLYVYDSATDTWTGKAQVTPSGSSTADSQRGATGKGFTYDGSYFFQSCNGATTRGEVWSVDWSANTMTYKWHTEEGNNGDGAGGAMTPDNRYVVLARHDGSVYRVYENTSGDWSTVTNVTSDFDLTGSGTSTVFGTYAVNFSGYSKDNTTPLYIGQASGIYGDGKFRLENWSSPETRQIYINEVGKYSVDANIAGLNYKTNEVEVTGSITPYTKYKSTVQKLYPSDGGTVSDSDYYGYVGLSGNGLVMVVVGRDDDDTTTSSGGFMVYEKVDGVWTFTQQITGVGTGSGSLGNSDEGKSVQLDYTGTRVFIGAHADDHTHNNSGSVYIYRRVAQGNWTLEQRIDAGGSAYRYGYNDVNNDGDKLMIGSYGYSSNTGRAWYYTRSGTTWTLQQQLAAPSTSAYGNSVSINSAGTRAIIGGYTHSSSKGRADIWNYSSGSWSIGAGFTGVSSSDFFGWNVDMSNDGNTVVVGAPLYSNGGEEGRAYIYTTSDGTNWSLLETLSNQYNNEWFGFSVQISGDGNAVVIGASKNDDGLTNRGKSYVYVKSGGSWPSTPTHTILGTTANANNGHTLGISDTADVIISGAQSDDDKGTDRGAVYILEKAIVAELKFDGSNKLSLTNTPTSTSSKLFLGSNTYDIGALTSDLTIETPGVYKSLTYDTGSDAAYFSKTTVGAISSTMAGYEVESIIPGYGSTDSWSQGGFGSYMDFSGDGTRMVTGMGMYNISGQYTGRAAVYHLENGSWVQKVDLTSTNTGQHRFGDSVCMSDDGTRIAVDFHANSTIKIYDYASGAWPTSPTVSISGTQSNGDMDMNKAGTVIVRGEGEGGNKAYIYTRAANGTWSETKQWGGYTGLGNGVTINGAGTRVLIGQRNASGSHPNYVGKVYEANYDGSSWGNLTEVHASAASTNNWPTRIRMDENGTTAVIMSGTSGQGRILERQSGTSWTSVMVVQGRCSFYSRGSSSISYDGTMVLTGDNYYTPSGGVRQGRAYLYEYSGGSWSLTKTYENPKTTPAADDGWGYGTAIAKNTKDRFAIGMPGDGTYGSEYGSVYVHTNAIPDFISFDTYNKLTLSGLTNPTSKIHALPTGAESTTTYDVGTATNIYIDSAGTYTAEMKAANKFALDSNVATGNMTPDLRLNENIVSINKFTTTNASEMFGHADAKNHAFSKDKSIFVTSSDTADGNSGNGKVFIYKRGSDGTYALDTTLNAVTGGTNNFGHSLDINDTGTRLVISEPELSWTNGEGRIHVYDRASTSASWPSTPTTTINASTDTGSHKGFGYDLALSGDGNTIGTSTYGGYNYHRAYIFEYSSSSWSETKTWSFSNATGDGASCDLSHDGTRFVVGSFTATADKWYSFHKSGSTWATSATEHTLASASRANIRISGNGNMVLVGAETDASCEIWEYDSSWSRTTTLTQTGNFGCSMASNYAGTIFAIAESTYNSNQGQVFIYSKSGSTITLLKTLVNPDAGSQQWFGSTGSLEIDYYGHILAVNAPGYNSSKGKVQLFEKPAPPSLTFDGFNKYTFTGADTGSTYKLKYLSNTYDLGTTSTVYIKDAGTYSGEIKGATNFGLSSNVVNTVTSPTTYRYIGFGGMTDLNSGYTTTYNYLLKLTKVDGTPLLHSDIDTFTILMNSSGTTLDFTHIFQETKDPIAAALGYTSTTWHGDGQITVTSLADGTALSDHATNTYIAFYFKLKEPTTIIDGASLTLHRNDKGQWKNAKAFGTNTDPSTFSSPHTPTDWTELVEVTTVDGPLGAWNGGSNPSEPWTSHGATQDFNASASGLQPSLTFDGYNKLTLGVLGSDATSNVTFDGNTYSIGSATDIYIENTGTYDAESKSASAFALTSNVVGAISSENPLQLHWNAYSSPASDSAGNSLTGTLNSVTDTSGAFTFDGSSSYIQLSTSNASDAKVQLPKWDISCDFYKTGSGTVGSWVDANAIVLITKGINASDGLGLDINYGLVIDSNNKIKTGFEESGPDQFVLVGTTTISNNQWYTARSTFDGTNLKVYLNGSLENSATTTIIPASNDVGPLIVGAGKYTTSNTPVAYFQGRIKNVKINKFIENPSLTFDGYKLVVKNITPTSSTLKYESNTYDIGSATNVYIKDVGTYTAEIGGATDFAFTSNVSSGTIKTIEPVITGGRRSAHALTYDGKLYGWGENSNGEVGVGDNSDKTVPTLCTGIPQGEVVSIWEQNNRAESRWAKTRDGRIWVTGDHDNYNLPNSSGDFTTFTDVSVEFGDYTLTSNSVVWASGGERATHVLMENGDVWSFGNDAGATGILGQGGSATSDRTPRKVTGISNVTKMASGGDLVIALDSSGNVYMWGSNDVGHGSPNWGAYNTPTNIMAVGTDDLTTLLAVDSETVTDIYCSFYSMFVLTNKGTVYGTGKNGSGQLGQGNTAAKSSTDGWVKIDYFTSKNITVNRLYVGGAQGHVFADTSDGWYCWGKNGNGNLALGDTTMKKTPVKWTHVSNIKVFGTGSDTLFAIAEDGKYYAWGEGSNDERGDATASDISYPKYIDKLPNILAPSFEFDGYDKISSYDTEILRKVSFQSFTYSGLTCREMQTLTQYNGTWYAWAWEFVEGGGEAPFATRGQAKEWYKSANDWRILRTSNGYKLEKVSGGTWESPSGYHVQTADTFQPDANGIVTITFSWNSHTAVMFKEPLFKNGVDFSTKFTKGTTTYDAGNAKIITVSDSGTYDAQLNKGDFVIKSATVPATTSTGLYTWAFHHGNFDNAYGDGDILTARDNGRFYADTPSYTGDIGTITAVNPTESSNVSFKLNQYTQDSSSETNTTGIMLTEIDVFDDTNTAMTYGTDYRADLYRAAFADNSQDGGTGKLSDETTPYNDDGSRLNDNTLHGSGGYIGWVNGTYDASATSINRKYPYSVDDELIRLVPLTGKIIGKVQFAYKGTGTTPGWKVYRGTTLVETTNYAGTDISTQGNQTTHQIVDTKSSTMYTFAPPSGGLTANVMMVAGGAGGGARAEGGGGGAGGLVYTAGTSLAQGATKTIAVGNGDSGGRADGENGFNGKNTTFTGLTTAIGGGGGAHQNTDPSTGGSGGGGNGGDGSNYNANIGASGTADQGHAGGDGANALEGGGGGGAGGVGANASSGNAGDGGIGKFFGTGSSFTNFGDEYGDGGWFAGGGGGGNRNEDEIIPGGRGGGGYGQSYNGYMGRGGSQHGMVHTGGGGGGGGPINRDQHPGYNTTGIGGVKGHAGRGGSGIVLIQTNVAPPNGSNTAVVQVGNPRRRSLPPTVDRMGSEVNRFSIIDSASMPTYRLPTHWYMDPPNYNGNSVPHNQGSHSLQKRADGGTSNVWYQTSYTYFQDMGSKMTQTVDAVFMPVEQQRYDVLLSIGNNNDHDIQLEMAADGTATLNRDDDVDTSLKAGTIKCFTVGKWHHIALTVDSGGNAVGYVNGYPVVSATYTSIPDVGSRGGHQLFRTGVTSGVSFRKFLTYEVSTYNFHMTPKQVMQRAAEVGLGPKLEYDGLNTLKILNTEPGSTVRLFTSNVADTSNVFIVADPADNEYTIPESGKYYAEIKGTDTFTITRTLDVDDPLYAYPPVVTGTKSSLTTSLSADTWNTWTMSGASTGNGQYQVKTSHATNAPGGTHASAAGLFTNLVKIETITEGGTTHYGFLHTNQLTNFDITLQLPSAKIIRKYVLYPADTNAPVSTPGGSVDPTLPGNGSEENTRRPKSWVLKGSTDGTSWTTIHTVTNKPPSIYGDVHTISSPASYQYYMLSISANNGSSSNIQLGEWQLWGDA